MRNLFRTIPALVAVLAATTAAAQTVEIEGVINRYVGVTRVDSCGQRVDVDSTVGFAATDRVLLVQMKGGRIDQDTIEDRFGRLIDIGQAGAYHFGTIESITGNTIILLEPVSRFFDVTGDVQLVRVPRYGNARVVAPVVARPWDGHTGAVVAFEVTDTLWLDADVDASGTGFRGGGRMIRQEWEPCDIPYRVTPMLSMLSGGRGETLAAFDTLAAWGGRGRAATAGGGGNSSNTGGGGGGGAGTGGVGGGQYTGLCSSLLNSGEGGIGLADLSADDRLFVGGGGGSGHSNNFTGTEGARGGGIIAVRASHVVGNGHTLSADGASVTVDAVIDGSGGGGGGGTVLIETDTIHSPVTLSARGGYGGSGAGPNHCHGPGGGGGGGFIAIRSSESSPDITTDVAGGIPGVYTADNVARCTNWEYGATAGTEGSVLRLSTVVEGHVGGDFTVTPIYGAPGDRVDLTLTYRGALDSAFRPIRGVTTTIDVDPDLLYLDSTTAEQVTPGRLQLYRPLPTGAVELARYSAILLVGTTNESTIRIVSVEPDLRLNTRTCAWAAKTTDAPLTIELCEAGSLRTVRVGTGTALRVIAPNPARGTTVITFSIAEDGPTRLTLVDAAGRTATSLYEGRLVAGEYSLPTDLAGIAAGRYLLRLSTSHDAATTPLVVEH